MEEREQKPVEQQMQELVVFWAGYGKKMVPQDVSKFDAGYSPEFFLAFIKHRMALILLWKRLETNRKDSYCFNRKAHSLFPGRCRLIPDKPRHP